MSINLSGCLDAPAARPTATSIGALVASFLGTRRTDQPVRRNSYDVGDARVSLFWRPLPTWFRRRQLDAAEAFERSTRQSGCQNGALGRVGLDVLRALHHYINWRTGELYPSLAQLCARTWRSRDAVVRALRRLARHGFVEWLRRSERVEDAEGAGPRVKQASNAYRLVAPGPLLAARRDAPLPADVEAHRRAAAEEMAGYLEFARATDARLDPRSLSANEAAALAIADPGLREALLRLDRALSASHPSGQNPA